MGNILGINCIGYYTSACLLQEGRIQNAICEERLSRIKKDRNFPHRAILYCLKEAGLRIEDIDDVFVGWHPRFYLRRSDEALIETRRSRGKVSYYAMNEVATHLGTELRDVEEVLRSENAELRIHYVDHHKAHVANAFLQSGYEKADVLMLDGFGEWTTGMSGRVDRTALEIFQEYPTPQSIGSFYSAFTEFLGFRPSNDEWKVMALSALGDSSRFYEQIRKLIKVDGLRFELDLSYFEHYNFFKPGYFSTKLVDMLGPPLKAGEEPGPREYDIVAAVQRVVEETIFTILGELQSRTGAKDLVVGGGVFMNSVCNGKLLRSTPYDRVFIGGTPEDSGISVGAALYGAHFVLGQPVPVGEAKHNYYGRVYSRDEIEKELKRRKLRYTALENSSETAAQLLHAGKIIGWFQGASEFGQRALGNRSILADPTRAEIKDLVNASVKYREGFRPFAPAILSERQDEVLEGREGQTIHFMEKVFQIREDMRAKVPAVTHFDGSGRPQTVLRETNPEFHALITAFEKLSGVPLVLNTSFNVNGMPLVESPTDALDCFFACGLDELILGHCHLSKTG